MWLSWVCRSKDYQGISTILNAVTDTVGGSAPTPARPARASCTTRVVGSAVGVEAAHVQVVCGGSRCAVVGTREHCVGLYFMSHIVVHANVRVLPHCVHHPRGLCVAVDEGDVPMDATYLAELRALMWCNRSTLLQVGSDDKFVGGR
jgi:glutaredoxin domain-containing cysteine-rich protein 1